MAEALSAQAVLAARDELGLGSDATLAEIKNSYLRLAKKWHPDRNPREKEAECKARMQTINEAYELILRYCENYRFSFEAQTVERNADFGRWWASRFGAPGTATKTP
ncbi:MAG: J domain-containing protein [Campylobacterales bacterium]